MLNDLNIFYISKSLPLTSSQTYWAAVGMDGISKMALPFCETSSLVYTLSFGVSSALTRTCTPSAGLPSGKVTSIWGQWGKILSN